VRSDRSKQKPAIEPLETRRLLAFGKTDAGFADEGRAVVTLTGSFAPGAQAVEDMSVLPGGSILAAGDAGIVKFNPDGRLDESFGDAGSVPFAAVSFRAVASDAAGNVFALLVGAGGTSVVKYDAQGSVAHDFGTDGSSIVTSNGSFFARAMTIDDDGRVLVAGTRRVGSAGAAVSRIYRLTDDGELDNGFGDHGLVDFQLGNPSSGGQSVDRVAGIAMAPDGHILIGGGSLTGGVTDEHNGSAAVQFDQVLFSTVRLNSNGSIDASYAVDGFARAAYRSVPSLRRALDEFGTTGVLPGAFAAGANGEVFLAANDGDLAFAAFDSSGALRFNDHTDPGYPLRYPSDATFLSDGRVVLLGQPSDVDADAPVSRGLVMSWITDAGEMGNPVSTDDLLDTTPDLLQQSPGAIAVAEDGRLLVGGAEESDDGGYEVVKFSAGRISDPRPDDFLNATVNDLATDSSGALHLAFYDSATNTLKYAYRAANGLWNGVMTVDDTPGAGGYLSLAVTSAGNPVIAYYAGATTDLKLASMSDGEFSLQTIDSKGSVGQYPSLAIDGSDRPRVSYYRKSSGDLRYAWRSGKGWRIQTIDGGDGSDVGRSSTLVINPRTGRSTAAYVDSTARQIKYAGQNKAGNWGIETAAKFKGGADFVSMAFSYYFGPMISFYDTRTRDLKVAYYTDSWQGQVIGDDSAQGLYTSLAFPDYYGDPSIYAWDRGADKIVLIDNSTDQFHSSDLVTGGGNYLSVAYNGNSTSIAYFDSASGILKIRPAQPPQAS
jgi:uncharacterized delta-60 repeat protein